MAWCEVFSTTLHFLGLAYDCSIVCCFNVYLHRGDNKWYVDSPSRHSRHTFPLMRFKYWFSAILLAFLSAEGSGCFAEGLHLDCDQCGSFTVFGYICGSLRLWNRRQPRHEPHEWKSGIRYMYVWPSFTIPQILIRTISRTERAAAGVSVQGCRYTLNVRGLRRWVAPRDSAVTNRRYNAGSAPAGNICCVGILRCKAHVHVRRANCRLAYVCRADVSPLCGLIINNV